MEFITIGTKPNQMDIWQEFLVALALLLVIEGILPFLNPAHWRDTMRKASELSDESVRWLGLLSMVFGIILLYWVH
jgi:uncharacterized protein YjeT (DUF2065 family)